MYIAGCDNVKLFELHKKQGLKLFETDPWPNTHRIIDIYIGPIYIYIFDVKYMISQK